MNQFEYLSVLISIVIGLAITQLLSGAARLIQIRHRVRMHSPTMLWMLTLFLIDTQIWWVAYDRHDVHYWNFFRFLLYMTMPIIAYLLSYLVLPELGDEDEIDLAANFDRNRTWFFGLLTALLSASLIEQAVRDGHLSPNRNLAFHCGFMALSLAGAVVRSSRFQFWNALAGTVLVCTYIGILFVQLH